MVRGDGLVKVLDFGLAKLAPTILLSSLAQSTRTSLHTNGGKVIGTIAYMSPEQARAEPLDARTDIFSVGTVLYEMVTGRQAFPGNSTAVVLDGILNRIAPRRRCASTPASSPRLEDIIDKALEKDRELRYQTASELRTDLIRLKRDTDAGGVFAVRDTSAAARSRGSRYRSRRTAATHRRTDARGDSGHSSRFARAALQFLFSRSELQEVQLTTNSSENPVSAAAISPDGKYLALFGSDRHSPAID